MNGFSDEKIDVVCSSNPDFDYCQSEVTGRLECNAETLASSEVNGVFGR
jgi:hypothetical protein